ncbi:MAG: FAD-binding protein, partial [Bacteroidales bacterium]
VPKELDDAKNIREGKLKPTDLPEDKRDYYLERRYPAFGNLVPRDVASRAAKERCDAGYGVGTGHAVYLDFKEAIGRLGKKVIEERYGNLFQMYEKIVDENPYETPMMIYPAIHYTMGGLWVDYELQTTIPGLFAIGEANFSDHGANRLGASALMQGLADGYFVLPFTIQNYLATQLGVARMDPANHPEFSKAIEEVQGRINKLMSIKGKRSVDSLHKDLGHVMWNHVGMGRTKEGLEEGIRMIREVREAFWKEVRIPGKADGFNVELEKACRLADFLDLGELMAKDALHREESCGGHFREEYQTEEGEALRDDVNFKYVAAWEYQGDQKEAKLYKEPLDYEFIEIKTRNYKE